MRRLLSSLDLSRTDYDSLLASASVMAKAPTPQQRYGSVVGLVFYSESIRTRVGFETAAARLGAASFLITQSRFTQVMSQPESVEDGMRSIAGWCDAIFFRHPDPTMAASLAHLVDVPVINCGNGSDEHPTQALIDLYAVTQLFGQIDDLRLAVIGDLREMRSAHSLVMALSRYRGIHIRCISPLGLELPEGYVAEYLKAGNTMEVVHEPDFDGVDAIYVAGLPRNPDVQITDATRDSLAITRKTLSRLNPDVRILCPLPRIDEIGRDVDETPNAVYFLQSKLGLDVRMAIIDAVLGGGRS